MKKKKKVKRLEYLAPKKVFYDIFNVAHIVGEIIKDNNVSVICTNIIIANKKCKL